MKFWLNLGEDKRVLSAAVAIEGMQTPEDAVGIDTLPEEDLHDYRYTEGGELVYDPVPPPDTDTAPPTLEERLVSLGAGLLEMILGGELDG